MSHYSTAPRQGWVIIHHVGSPNSHTVETNSYCTSGYDFTVSRQGRIFVCRDNANTFFRWTRNKGTTPVWHASGCDCQAIGICMHGCFGGCSSGNVANPSASQRCSVSFLIAHLGTPLGECCRIRPHAECHRWNPCNHSNPLRTVCPGTEFTGGVDRAWNAKGRAFRDRLRTEATNWKNNGCCNPPCSNPQ